MPMKEPPMCGELLVEVSRPPVSQQSKRAEKDSFAKLIYEQLEDPRYLLSGDVTVEIEWYVHEQDRYESDIAPDVDNILKPLLDALCGLQGVLIDDCQVQAVDCHWLDSYDHKQKVEIRLRFRNDEWVSKDALVFIHFGRGLCFPLNLGGPPGVVLALVEHLCNMLAYRDALVESGREYYQAKNVMSIQRLFHRTRLGRFCIIELDALRKDLEEDIARQPVTADLEELNQLIAKTRSLRQKFSKPDGLVGI